MGLFLVIAAIAWKFSTQNDGFQDVPPPGAEPGLNSPVISPRAQTLTKGEIKPFADPSTALLAPPPGQTSSVSSLPAEDPALEKSTARRLYGIYESLMGFFNNEAQGLSALGDSSITLPMSTAKADLGRLRDELSTMDRNPGLQSTLTQDDVNGIDANLAYLQKKWRLSANALGAPSPMPPASEGFQSGRNWFSYFFGGTQEGFQPMGSDSGTGTGPSGTGMGPSSTGMGPSGTGMGPSGTGMGPSTSGSSPSSGGGASSSTCSGSSCKAGLPDLQNLTTNIMAEIVRLQASGAQDSTTQNRLKLLSTILQTVTDMTTGLTNGTIKPADIKITMGQVKSFLANIQNPNSPLTNMLSDWGLPSGLSNLFPTYAAGDVSGADLAKQLFGKYITDIKNLSWDIELSYKGQAEQDIAANYAAAMKDARYYADTVGTPVASNSDKVAGAATGGSSTAGAYRGLFDNVINSVAGQTGKVNAAMGPTHPTSHEGGKGGDRGVQNFDWMQRAKEICSQINMREMDPYEFGCLKDPKTVRQDNFSWRGHTKMICTRLSTVYDPSIPELCGCPPPSWIGWRP